jgi:hypothetical protein
MNRRVFLKLSSSGVAVAVITPASLLTTGCSFSVLSTLNVITEAIEEILAYVGNTQPWVTALQKALVNLQQAIATWKAGGTEAIVIDALNTLEDVTAVIPFTAAYSPLIDLIVSGIEAIINYFIPQSSSMQFTKPRAESLKNPHIGRVVLKTPSLFHPTYAGAFKAQYNDLAVGIGLSQLRIDDIKAR